MKDGTIKLSGLAKDRFIERFIADEPELAVEARQRLTTRAKSAFASVRVRRAVMARQRLALKAAVAAGRVGRTVEAAAAAAPEGEPPEVEAAVQGPPAPPPAAAPAASLPTAQAPFDAYAVKLVPVYQREGRDGLLARLAGVTEVEHLRQMAKAQQIILPQDLRSGDIEADVIRTAMADAVVKRIADRRAAAG